MPRKEGFFVGTVVDTNDPEDRNRLKVRVPELHGNRNSLTAIQDSTLPWLECMITGAEKFFPVKGEFVWVTYEDSSATSLLVLGVKYTTGGRFSVVKNKPITFDGGGAAGWE